MIVSFLLFGIEVRGCVELRLCQRLLGAFYACISQMEACFSYNQQACWCYHVMLAGCRHASIHGVVSFGLQEIGVQVEEPFGILALEVSDDRGAVNRGVTEALG